MALNIGEKVNAATSAVSTGVSSVVNSAVAKTTPNPTTSVADSILATSALKFGIAAPGPEASLARRALVTPFHYADKASAAVGTGLAHAAKAVRNTIDLVISSVVTAISMALKAVAFTLTAISIPVIGAVGASVAVATSPFTAPAAAVAFKKDKEIKALTEENSSLKAQIATGSVSTSEKTGPTLFESAKAAGAKAQAAIASVLPKSKEGKIALGVGVATALSLAGLGYAASGHIKDYMGDFRIDHSLSFEKFDDETQFENLEVNTFDPSEDEKIDLAVMRQLASMLPTGTPRTVQFAQELAAVPSIVGNAILKAPGSIASWAKDLPENVASRFRSEVTKEFAKDYDAAVALQKLIEEGEKAEKAEAAKVTPPVATVVTAPVVTEENKA